MQGKLMIYYPNGEVEIILDAYVEHTNQAYVRFRNNAGYWVESTLPYYFIKGQK